MQDVIGPDYTFFGYVVAECSTAAPADEDSCRAAGAQSALSIMNGMNQLMSMGTAVLGGWLSDRFGKRAVLTAVFLFIIWPIVVQAYTTSFTVVVLLNLYNGLLGGTLGAPINGLMADVLPVGADGKPTHPTRDWNLICQAWSLPGIVWPLVLGSAFSWFATKRDTYTAFFLMNATLNTLQIPLLYPIVPRSKPGGAAAVAEARRGGYGAPPGAGLCDRLLFKRMFARPEPPPQQQQQEGKEAAAAAAF
jgi:MFS family permease